MSDAPIKKPSSKREINPNITTYIDVREVTTYRWKQYKPDGQRQMKAKGRWQRETGTGHFPHWVNCPPPVGEWRLNATEGPRPIPAPIEPIVARCGVTERE